MSKLKGILCVLLLWLLAACGGGGGSAGTTTGGSGSTPGTNTPTVTVPSTNSNTFVAGLSLTQSATTINADGASTVSFAVSALDSGNALLPNVLVNFAVNRDSGVLLSAGSVLTGSNGVAVVTITTSTTDQNNRTATVVASCTGCSGESVSGTLQVVGASLSLATADAALIENGPKTVLTATLRNAAGSTLGSGIPITFASSSNLALGSTTVITNIFGQASTTVAGISVGATDVTFVDVSALKTTRRQNYTVGTAVTTMAFTSPPVGTIITVGSNQAVVLSAAGASSVTLATTLGTFVGGGNSITKAVSGGRVQVDLVSTRAGVASISAVDNLGRSAALNVFVSPPVSAANKLILNATRTTIPVSSASTQSSVIVTAKATSFDGTTDQPVANVPVVFSLVGGPGSGEFLSPAIALTDSAGNATATFTAGTSVSITNGLRIAAGISGTGITTGVSPSGNDLLMTIGGGALSVAFGRASVLESSSDDTLYIQNYSVLVADAAGNPVSGAVVTLRLQPFAFAIGPFCNPTATYCSEDRNGNNSLDAGEDGVRTEIPSSANENFTPSMCPLAKPSSSLTGSLDAKLTPQNSDGGSVPSTVTTDANGTAQFAMTYLKASAYFVVNKLTATVSANGTESSNFLIFRLQPTQEDAGPPCTLPASRYAF